MVCSLVFVCSFGKDHVINNNRFSCSCDERESKNMLATEYMSIAHKCLQLSKSYRMNTTLDPNE